MGKSQQRKGNAGEKELSDILNAEGFITTPGGSQTYGTVPDVSGLRGIHIEVKRVERLNLDKAMQQACRDADRFRDGLPAVFHRRNRQPWLVTMPLDCWLRIYKAALRAPKSERKK